MNWKSFRISPGYPELTGRRIIMSSNLPKLFEFMALVGRLKRVKRTGWVLRKVKEPESVADHMYRMAVLSFLVDSKSTGIDKDRCIKMSLVHDMAESIVGDLTPSDGVSKEEKRILEENAIKRITGLLSEELSKEIYTLWLIENSHCPILPADFEKKVVMDETQEYEEQTTKEAMFVKDLDKFEMILQAEEYEQIDKRPQALQEFFDSTKGKFQTPQVKEWVEELCAKRRNDDNTKT